MVDEGWSLSDVQAFCDKYELILGEVKYEQTEMVSPGTILRQSRTAGTTIVRGTTLIVTVAEKPKEQPKPTPKPEEKKASDYTTQTDCEKAGFSWNTETEKCSE